MTKSPPGISVGGVFHTDTNPPPARPAGHGEFRDLGVAPGLVRWMIVGFDPGAFFDLHHTDTIDLDIVVDGTLELTLEDGAHQLVAGDAVVVTGVDHGWRAGPDGCRLSVTVIGTPPVA